MENQLKDKKSKQSIFYHKVTNLISIKKQNKAFHPNAKKEVLIWEKKYFVLKEQVWIINRLYTMLQICLQNIKNSNLIIN